MKEIALSYAERGWKVFPLHAVVDGQCTCGVQSCADAGKHPKLPNGVLGASSAPAQVAEWFDGAPANIGIATGRESGLTVVDVDIADGKKGGENWAALIA